MDEEMIVQTRKWVSKEEAKKMFPSNECKDQNKWLYECYICGARSKGEGKLVKSCNCKHGPPKKLYKTQAEGVEPSRP